MLMCVLFSSPFAYTFSLFHALKPTNLIVVCVCLFNILLTFVAESVKQNKETVCVFVVVVVNQEKIK